MERNTEIYIYGAGNYGLACLSWLECKGLKVKGFIDQNASKIKTLLDVPVFAPKNILPKLTGKRNLAPKIIIAIRNKEIQRKIVKKLAFLGFRGNFEIFDTKLGPLMRPFIRPFIFCVNTKKRILEIGPLNNPIFRKNDSNVFYADINTKAQIEKIYTDVPKDEIVEIDYVIKGSYSQSLKNVEKFDYVVMSHVIEHIPDVISFFQDITKILNPKGKLCLAIPDKRYCYDHFRQSTSFAEAYDIYMRKVTNNPMRILDAIMNDTINSPKYFWENKISLEMLPKDKKRYLKAKETYLKALKGKYSYVHFSVFTPQTFLLFLYNMLNFNLLPFKCIKFYDTILNSPEFNCVLEFEPNLLVENSPQEKKERNNLVKLLQKVADGNF